MQNKKKIKMNDKIENRNILTTKLRQMIYQAFAVTSQQENFY